MVFKEGGEATYLCLGVAVRVKDSGESARYEIFAYAVLAESAPLNVTQQDMAHSVNERAYTDRKMLVKVWQPPVLIEARNMGIEPRPGAFLRVWNRGLNPTILDEPSDGADWIELKVDPFGLAAHDVEWDTSV